MSGAGEKSGVGLMMMKTLGMYIIYLRISDTSENVIQLFRGLVKVIENKIT